jgi:hypothetical protein
VVVVVVVVVASHGDMDVLMRTTVLFIYFYCTPTPVFRIVAVALCGMVARPMCACLSDHR